MTEKRGTSKQSSKKDKPSTPDVVTKVTLSSRLKDRRIKLAEDRLVASGDRGYASVLATHGARNGRWYFEVSVEGEEGNFRVGWSSRKTRFDFPIGSDIFSFALSHCGARVVQAYRAPYSPCRIKSGDILGCLIDLANSSYVETSEHPIWNGLVCDPEHPSEDIAQIQESEISFFLNGESLGVAFQRIPVGEYYPAASLFGRAKVRFNFGPTFTHLQPQASRPISDLFDPLALRKPPARPPPFIPRGAAAEA
jgi:Set1/Ash2 histone methyltransferase complex subunit ASH2